MTEQTTPMTDETIAAQDSSIDTARQDLYPKNSTAAAIKQVIEESKNLAKSADADLPKHWSEKDKGVFNTLDGKTKQWLLQRHRDMESDYTKKTMGLSEERKKYGDLNKIFEPHREELNRYGLNESQAVQELLRLYQSSQQTTVANPPTGQGDEERNAIKQSIADLQKRFTAQQTQQQAIAIRIGQQKIKELTDSKDETGKNKYPHFDDLLPSILMLAHADLVEGRAPQLVELYERAMWANPKLRQDLLSAQLRAAEQDQAQQRKEKLLAAQKAGSSVYGAAGNNLPSQRPARTIREELEAAFREATAV